LSTLRERIETDSPLEPKDQIHLVFELRHYVRESGPADEVIVFFERLKKRAELLANVSRDIDELLGEVNRQRNASKEPKPLPLETSHLSSLNTMKNRIEADSPLEVQEQVQLVSELSRRVQDEIMLMT
jgi:hypothetical protein